MAILNCIYGESSSRKTSSLGKAARYMYEKTGLPGRAIYSDTGNWQVIAPEVDAGLIEPFLITGEPELLMLLHKLARGEWPVELSNGHAVARHPVQPKDPLGIGAAKMAKTPDIASKVSFYIWEGITSTSELLMKYLRDYRVDIKAKDPLSPFQATDQDSGQAMKFCANTMGHYGFVQDEIISSIIPELAALPIERIFISAHEAAATDEDTKLPIRGPAVVGKAGTTRIGKNLGDVIHYEVFNKVDPKNPSLITTDVRAYYRSHPDPKFPNMTYNCKTRLPADKVGALEKEFPGGFFAPGDMDRFLRVYDGLLAQSGGDMLEWKKKLDAARAEGGK